MTGVAVGSAIVGMRPVMSHQRMDFVLTAMDQLVNTTAKWHYMFGGKVTVPLTVRMIIGRGWGQGAQHSQNLQALFVHIPGLKVVMPTTPHDAKGLLISSVEDNNPVMFIEHRWLHNQVGEVPEEAYRVPIGTARVIKEGSDVTIAATSYMTLEAVRAAEILDENGINVEVIDLRSLSPMDTGCVVNSVRKTGRLVVADSGWKTGGITGELAACISEEGFSYLKAPVRRIAPPDTPTPTSFALTKKFYPGVRDFIKVIGDLLERDLTRDVDKALTCERGPPHDVPDPYFRGPF